MIAIVATLGLLVGGVRIRGLGLGSAGVLFVGIVAGHLGFAIDHEIAHFAKEFGLVLFVFTIGLQLGPGIVRLWKRQGIALNLFAVSVVMQGVGLVLLISYSLGYDVNVAAGLFSGATTNTPSLGAAQQAVAGLPSEGSSQTGLLATAYAVAYPGGILGIIASILALKYFWDIDAAREEQIARIASGDVEHEPIERRCILIDNTRLSGVPFGEIPGLEETGVRISRIKRRDDEQVHPATETTAIESGDVIQVVGTTKGLNRFQPLIGQQSSLDLMTRDGDAKFQQIVVTAPAVLNKSLRELSLDHRFDATVTRLRRAGIEMTGNGSTRLQYGDVVQIVGRSDSLARVTSLLGNSVKSLDETRFAPLFFGIAVGVLIGMIPISLPGLPFTVKLGLAGGPLIAAIMFSMLGRLGGFVWYMPNSANLAIRELGIILFLASAGLTAGETFFRFAMTPQGMGWMVAGFAITTIPLVTTAIVARTFFKLDFLTICGAIAGSMTDPPALAFASSLSETQISHKAYAAVYPLTMILRIIAAQAIVFALA